MRGAKMRKLRILASCGVALALSHATFGGTVTYNFNDGTTDGLVQTNSLGFSSSVAGGVLNVNQAVGAGNGFVALQTPFSVSGDFTATVMGTRNSDFASGNALGLGFGTFSTTVADVFFSGTGQVRDNINLPSRSVNGVSDSSSAVTFEITRVGDMLTLAFNNGSGFQTVASETDPSLTIASSLSLLFDEEAANTGSHSGTFDNLTITSDSVPEPSSCSVALLGGLGVMTLIRRRMRHVLS